MGEAESEFDYGAYCGLYCGACEALAATECGDVEKLLEHEEPGYTVRDLTCRGCRTDVTACFCTDCEMRRCAREKGVAFCCDCGGYPCELLKAFDADKHPHHSGVLTNLDAIRDRGAAAWLAAQLERWKCPACGARFTWYEDKCGSCGAAVRNCRQE